MPEETLKAAQKEFKRLSRMGESSGEASMLRTWLELMAELPWKAEAQTAMDIAEARKVLDEDHFGLEKVKRRILEYLAVRKLNPEGKSPILCFVGPPGVGKTSLGQSIARATGRKFQRVALGGTHDEAEIRGHRRTYIGALPGNIIQAVRRGESRTTVLMLDEIDKRYLVRRQLEANGLKPEQAAVTESALRAIVSDYTREAGVRNLEREIGSAFRATAMKVAEGATGQLIVDVADLQAILGVRRFENEAALRTAVPGVATGLASTPLRRH